MRTSEEICATLGRWPRQVLPDYRALASDCATHIREAFDAQKVIIAFSEGDEPWLVIAEADAAGSRVWEDDEADYALVDESLARVSFHSAPGKPVRIAPDASERNIAQAIDRNMLAACGDAAIFSIPFEAEETQGRVFISAPKAEESAMMLLAQVIGTIISMRFEATGYALRSSRDAVAEERIRVARDLHDGLLQSFTGVVLQLETIHSTLESRPEEARRMITETQAIIMSDQRELRHFVEQLRPRPARRDTPFDFPARLEALRSRFETQWGIRVALDVERIEPLVGGFLGQETFRLIHEAVTNSAKHGGATDVHVGLRTDGSEMRIEVSDNGSGFPFQGRLTLDEMRQSGGGPTVLAERVHALNGDLVVDSSDTGSTVTISIPLGWGGN